MNLPSRRLIKLLAAAFLAATSIALAPSAPSASAGTAARPADPTAYENVARLAFELELADPKLTTALMRYYDWEHMKSALPESVRLEAIRRSGADLDYLDAPGAYASLPKGVRRRLSLGGWDFTRWGRRRRWRKLPAEERLRLVDIAVLSDEAKARLVPALPLQDHEPPLKLGDYFELRPDAPEPLKRMEVEFDGSPDLYLEYKTAADVRGVAEPLRSLEWLMKETGVDGTFRAGAWTSQNASIHYHFSFPGLPGMEPRLGARMHKFGFLKALEGVANGYSPADYREDPRRRGYTRYMEGDHGEVRHGTQSVRAAVAEDFYHLTLSDEQFDQQVGAKTRAYLRKNSVLAGILAISPEMLLRGPGDLLRDARLRAFLRQKTQGCWTENAWCVAIQLRLDPANEQVAAAARERLRSYAHEVVRLPRSRWGEFDPIMIELIRSLGESRTRPKASLAALQEILDSRPDRVATLEPVRRYALAAQDRLEPLDGRRFSELVEDGFLHFPSDWTLLRDLMDRISSRKPVPAELGDTLGRLLSRYMSLGLRKDPGYEGVAATFFGDLADELVKGNQPVAPEALKGLTELASAGQPPELAGRAALALLRKGILPARGKELGALLDKLADPDVPLWIREQAAARLRELGKSDAKARSALAPFETDGKLAALTVRPPEEAKWEARLRSKLAPIQPEKDPPARPSDGPRSIVQCLLDAVSTPFRRVPAGR